MLTKGQMIEQIRFNQTYLRRNGMMTNLEFFECLHFDSFTELFSLDEKRVYRILQRSEYFVGLDTYKDAESIQRYAQTSFC